MFIVDGRNRATPYKPRCCGNYTVIGALGRVRFSSIHRSSCQGTAFRCAQRALWLGLCSTPLNREDASDYMGGMVAEGLHMVAGSLLEGGWGVRSAFSLSYLSRALSLSLCLSLSLSLYMLYMEFLKVAALILTLSKGHA